MNLTTTTLTFYNPLTYYPHLGLGTYLTSAILIILLIIVSIDPILRLIKACQSSHTPDVRDDIIDEQTLIATKE